MNFKKVLLCVSMMLALCPPLLAAPASPPEKGKEMVPETFNMDAPPTGKKAGQGKPKAVALQPDDYLSPSVPLTPRERNTVQMVKDAENSSAPPMQAGGKILYAYGATTPTVICAPLQICDVELQPGETVNEVIPGDSVRWSMELVKSGDTPHVLIKPIDAGLSTSAVITTNRRFYYLYLKSQKTGHTPHIAFLYSDENAAKLKDSLAANRPKPQEEMATADLSKLNFTYDIKGDTAWKPLQVYDDSRQMFIKFPDQIQSGDAPILLVRNNGQDTMANFRMKNLTMVVDGVFSEAILISGVGSKQQRITIRKK
ncbi:MAG: P-type conjugative transfer protein TrbG [Desulfovibrionaceae bacterium]|nr:P-type conjugative transfer protein TrbG [Desulfovibrionaceae bacterium]MBF0515343.1 P-type conjugative transfer protein TrbG [Desulfovibrionaceae bacterium]